LRVSTRRLAAASAVGTTLEWYDFTVYNTLAALIFNRLFFPSFDPATGIILAFSTYAVGYISRPLGGVVFGHLGDKLGRRFVLFMTVTMMGVNTGLMGLLPTYESIGIVSPILLVTLRFIQGVALGGEWAGAVLISIEHGTQDTRGLNASFAQIGPALGNLLASGCIALVTYRLSSSEFLSWGWRIPLLSSVALVGVGVWIRLGVDETPMFKRLDETGTKTQTPIADVFRMYWRRLLIAGGVRVGSDVLYALIFIFSLTYLTAVRDVSRTFALTTIIIGTIVNAVAIVLSGALSDRLGRRPVYAAGGAFGLVWAFAFFVLVDRATPIAIVTAVVVGALVHALMYGPQAAFVTEQFPTQVRYAGSSLAYTLAGIVGGGFAPLIMASLFQQYRATTPISMYVAATLCVTLAALAVARETAKSRLE